MADSAELKGFHQETYQEINTYLESLAGKGGHAFVNYGYETIAGRPDLSQVKLPSRHQFANSRLSLENVGAVDLRGKRVLDVGCGRGGNLATLLRHFEISAGIGVDLTHSSLQAATHRGRGLNFVNADAETLPIATRTVDVVVSTESAHSYPHPWLFYAESRRVAVDHGWFCMSDLVFTAELPAYRQTLEAAGWKLRLERDITDNVLASIRRSWELREQLGEPMPSKLIADYMAAEGSVMRKWLEAGILSYVTFQAQATRPYDAEAAHEYGSKYLAQVATHMRPALEGIADHDPLPIRLRHNTARPDGFHQARVLDRSRERGARRAAPDTRVDLGDIDLYTNGFPYEEFERIREQEGLTWNPPAGNRPGFWVVSRYQDVVEVGNDATNFSSAKLAIHLEDPDTQSFLGAQLRLLIFQDAPEHSDNRRQLGSVLREREFVELTDLAYEWTSNLLPKLPTNHPIDWVSEVAKVTPTLCLAWILGMDQAGADWLTHCAELLDSFEVQKPSRDFEKVLRLQHKVTTQLLADSRSAEVDGFRIGLSRERSLIGRLAERYPDLERAKLTNILKMVMDAGHETTRSLLVNLALAICEFPNLTHALRDGDLAIESTVEEVLRFYPGIIRFRRTAVVDSAIGGFPIRRGERVAMFYPSANRDSQFFDAADTFDPTRSPNNHLAFGRGPHSCLGAWMARRIGQATLQAIVDSPLKLDSGGQGTNLRGNFLAQPTALHVTLTSLQN